MVTLVEALHKKYEKIKECSIFSSFSQKSSNRRGINVVFPDKTLTMDCEGIRLAGDKRELKRKAGHVVDLDLSGNEISSWSEVFTLLRCFDRLESLNLSQNPLGPPSSLPSASLDRYTRQLHPVKLFRSSDNIRLDNPHNRAMDIDRSSPVAAQSTCNNNSLNSTESSPLIRSISFDGLSSSTTDDSDYEISERSVQNHNNPDLMSKFNLEEHVKTCQNMVPPVQQLVQQLDIPYNDLLFLRLSTLVINGTEIPWYWVIDLLRAFPNLNTLHVALNNYGQQHQQQKIAASPKASSSPRSPMASSTPCQVNDDFNDQDVFPNLQTLYYSDNGVTNWWSICHLGQHFPNLKHLVLLGNPIERIPSTTVQLTRSVTLPLGDCCHSDGQSSPTTPFVNVDSLGLAETLLAGWESIDALVEWMPHLAHLRLGSSLPLFQSWSEAECRAHVIARIASLVTYNRSTIETEERERAERGFVRHFGQLEPSVRPARYWELERHHGRLEPFPDINFTPKRSVKIRVALDGKEVWHQLSLSLKVSQAKRQLLTLFEVNPSHVKQYRLFHFSRTLSSLQGPDELKYPNLAVYSYQPEPGDLFELVQTATASTSAGRAKSSSSRVQ